MAVDKVKKAAVEVIRNMLPRTMLRRGKEEYIGAFDAYSMAWQDTLKAISRKHKVPLQKLEETTTQMLRDLGNGNGTRLDYEV